MKTKKIILLMFIEILLSSCGITSKVRQSLIPERQEITAISKSYEIMPEDISFKTKDGITLKGWWIEGNSDITIVLSHSFGANRSGWEGADASGNRHKIDWLPSLKLLADKGYNIITFDHRACGESEGDLTYFGVKEAFDITAAVEWVNNKNVHLTKFGIIGFSSGANATLRAIRELEKDQRFQLSGIAINIYWYERMIKKSMRFFTKIPLFMLPAIKKSTEKIVGFNPEKEINPANTLSSIQSPILLVNAENDEIGSIEDATAIYKRGITNTKLQILNDETRFDAYHFIEKHPADVFHFFKNNLNTPKMKNTVDNTAILLIEFQKTWTDKGIFHKIIRKEYEKRNVLKNTMELVTAVRQNNIMVIQAPLILNKKDKNYKKTPFPARLLKRFTTGTWKAEFTDGIYDKSDIVIEGRYGFDATEGSNLEAVLTKSNIKTIYVCGFTTDHCVKETMDSLIDKGFKCIMVSDCSATKNQKIQQKIENEFTTITSKQLIIGITE